MAPALLALLLAPALDPSALLQKVALRYAAFDSFLLEVRERRLPLDISPPDPVVKRLAAAPEDHFFLEIRSAIRYSIVSDGETVRSGRHGAKVYFEEELGLDAHRQVEEEIETHVRRFALLSRVASAARYLRAELVKTSSGPVECAVIEILQRVQPAGGWRETLWIDPARALVLRSDFQPSLSSRARLYREYLLPPGLEPPGPALFVFTPRKGARPQPSPSSPFRLPSAASETLPPSVRP